MSANDHRSQTSRKQDKDKDQETLDIRVDLSGGAELLFGGVREYRVSLPLGDGPGGGGGGGPWTLRGLLVWIRDNLLRERPELFLKGETVRPGILVLVNDADWELLGQLDYQLQDGDAVTFISTLHGG